MGERPILEVHFMGTIQLISQVQSTRRKRRLVSRGRYQCRMTPHPTNAPAVAATAWSSTPASEAAPNIAGGCVASAATDGRRWRRWQRQRGVRAMSDEIKELPCPFCEGRGVRHFDTAPGMTSVETCDICGKTFFDATDCDSVVDSHHAFCGKCWRED